MAATAWQMGGVCKKVGDAFAKKIANTKTRLRSLKLLH